MHVFIAAHFSFNFHEWRSESPSPGACGGDRQMPGIHANAWFNLKTRTSGGSGCRAFDQFL
jgi:hypothetical protein